MTVSPLHGFGIPDQHIQPVQLFLFFVNLLQCVAAAGAKAADQIFDGTSEIHETMLGRRAVRQFARDGEAAAFLGRQS